MILTAASSLYGAAAAWRRRWYARDHARRKRLARPVVSIGNLTTGGSGKTPMVGEIARLLMARSERPAILTRGYARRHPADGVTVVSDGRQVLADVDHAGDEPFMLAQALPGVAVLVGADRYLSGCLAEQRLGATVHLLDDGFQHLALARDVDLLLADETDLDERVLPSGRLRERLDAAAAAQAILAPAGSDESIDRLRRVLGVAIAFTVRRSLGAPVWLRGTRPTELASGSPVFAVAAIARPERFFDDLRAAGFLVSGAMSFRDHHGFTDKDLRRIADEARGVGAVGVLVTDKDAARIGERAIGDPPMASVPLVVRIEPPSFVDWLFALLSEARASARPEAGRP